MKKNKLAKEKNGFYCNVGIMPEGCLRRSTAEELPPGVMGGRDGVDGGSCCREGRRVWLALRGGSGEKLIPPRFGVDINCLLFLHYYYNIAVVSICCPSLRCAGLLIQVQHF